MCKAEAAVKFDINSEEGREVCPFLLPNNFAELVSPNERWVAGCILSVGMIVDDEAV